MAIVIPSKHIYDKDNNKIRDNKIDRIEVNATEITPDNEYETSVYNKDILFLENEIEIEEEENISNIGSKSEEQGGEFPGTYYAVVLLDNKNTYLKGTIEIPKVKNNHYVNRVYYEEDGEKPIGISIYATKQSQSSNVSYIIPKYNNGQPTHYFSEKTFGTEITEDTQTGLIDLPFVVTNSNHGATATVESLGDNTKTVLEFKEQEDKYIIKYKILFRIEISYFKGNGYRSWLERVEIPCVGEKFVYEANKIEITVYGNTIGIDLTDKTVYIPDENGNKPFSVEGKELMQTSNYYTLKQVDDKDLISPTSYWVGKSNYNNYAYYTSVHIDGEKNSWETYVDYKDTKDGVIKTVIIPPRQNTHSPALETTETDTIEIIKVYNKNSIFLQFQDTLLEYSNGKETATILCDISDYYDTEGNKVIFQNGISKSNISFTWDKYISADITQNYYRSYITLTKGNIKQGDIIKTINGYIEFETDANIGDKCWCKIYGKAEDAENIFEIGSAPIERVEEMTFSMYDVVIPRVYGANGVDKPMSKYKDGTPKKFKVLGTRIFYDGAVWQELTLQETLE